MSITHTAETLSELLEMRAAQHPDCEAYTFLTDGETEAGTFTYGMLNQEAERVASLISAEVPEGGRAMLVYPSSLDFVAAFMGCLKSRVANVPVYPPLKGRAGRVRETLEAIVQDCRPHVVLTTEALLPDLQKNFSESPILARLRWVVTDQPSGGTKPATCGRKVQPDDVALIQYTSGSTSRPKGVVVTHKNLLHNLELVKSGFESLGEMRVVSWLPLYHDMGLIGTLLQPLYVGGFAAFMPPLSFLQRPVRWLSAISRYRATASGGPNFAYELCVKSVSDADVASLDLRTWTQAFNGAEPIRASTLRAFSEKFARAGFRNTSHYPCYGLAESTLIVTGGQRDEAPTHVLASVSALQSGQLKPPQGGEAQRELISSGRALKDVEVCVVRAESETGVLEACASGVVGEIWVSSPSVAQGYLNQPEISKETFEARLPGDPKVYLRTGDLGVTVDGHVFLTGRLKDLIIVRGKNFYPHDIEDLALSQRFSLKLTACGAYSLGEESEDVGVTLEIARPLRLLSDDAARQLKQEVSAFLTKSLGLPVRQIRLVGPRSLPRTSSGKVKRFACRDDHVKCLQDPSEQVIKAEQRLESFGEAVTWALGGAHV